ncbi:exported protein of unknown function [Candidatus Saccharimonas aalborgensis]|jgi:hypothetical protein|uniref:VCBS repeat-containing protein n=1 Tax=Candidatus Saccharimonas aalborgensis TaxID=1332188 RepID=R4PKX6_9BACT|nr:FG-GAP repeat protein [Candidatus Saccharimonas aalborgensis]AGL62208.1 exported protein of unknown function [Candidatus Saccharimonas aalborgensis]
MMKKGLYLSAFLLIVCVFAHAPSVNAATFDPGRIIDDAVFTNYTSMNVANIQSFLNSKVPSCDTNGTQPASDFGRPDLTHAQYAALKGWQAPPYTCLRDYTENGKSAAQVIYDVSQQYHINPQVFIVLLQKETGLVTDTWPLAWQYRTATGYGCPDSTPGVCDSTYNGYTNQVSWAGRLFRSVVDQSPSWYSPYVMGPNYVQWSPNASCGGTIVNVQNWSTAALYDYTPYQPNAAALAAGYGKGDSCSAYGNRNFFLYFTEWFGDTTLPDRPLITNYNSNLCTYLKATREPHISYCTPVQSGDFNGDGYADLAVTSTYPDGQSFNLWLFPGSATGLGDPVFQQHFSSSQYWMINNLKITATNINGDAYTDLTMFAANAYDGITVVQINGDASGLKSAPVMNTVRNLQPNLGWRWSNIR